MFHCFLYEHLWNVKLKGIAIQYKKSVESCTVFISLLLMGDRKHKTDYRPYCKCVSPTYDSAKRFVRSNILNTTIFATTNDISKIIIEILLKGII